MATTSWISPSPAAKYGGAFTAPPAATKDDTPLAQVAGPAPAGAGVGQLLHPNNPLFWVGAILAGAIGLAAVSTTVRVGGAKVSASLGDG
jgi:hypothetical protein